MSALTAGVATVPEVFASTRRTQDGAEGVQARGEQAPAPQTVDSPSGLRVESVQEERAARDPQARSPWLDYYIVRLKDEPLAAYTGGIRGLAATSPRATGARKLDVESPAAASYRGYLRQKQDQALAAIQQEVGHGVDVLHRYDAALNGFAIKLTPEEARRIAKVDGVEAVERNELHQPLTDVGPAWIGAPGIWDGTASGGVATKGEGMIVGVIDTGINSDHPSFADIGGDAFDHTNPFGSGNYVGWCESGFPLLMTCNDKLIGMWSYVDSGNNPEDDDGHGSHTASTAAGNQVSASLVAPTITVTETISGVAPHANIIMYDACAPGGCPNTALVASINQTVLDGVDVINYSISGGTAPYGESTSLAFLNATAAGVFVSASAGNSGPGASTLGHQEPWVQSVAASTHNRKFVNRLIDMSGGSTTPPANMTGQSLTGSLGATPIVYAGDFGDPLCPLGAFAPGTFTGQIVVCDRGIHARVDKAQSVLDGGAGGFVLANDAASGNSLVADAYALPGVHITHTDGTALKTWLSTGSGHTASIEGTTRDLSAVNGDIMAAFSSRGPNSNLPDIPKPDVTAPGVNVWAADMNGTPPEYQLLSGTSMSSPHSAGAATLLRALKPTWTPPMVKSALMLTAQASGVLKEDGATPAGPFDRGAGRIDLSKAATVGFVLDETAINFRAANPAADGDPTTLNLVSLGDGSCFQKCSWSRTVLSVVNATRTWTGTVSAPSGMTVKITTANPFSLAAFGARRIGVEVDASLLPKDQWHFATITWSDGAGNSPDLVMPISVFPTSSTDSLTLTKTVDFKTTAVGAPINYTINVTNPTDSEKTFTVTDPIPANTTYVPGSATGGLTFNAGPNTLTGSTGSLDPLSFSVAPEDSPFGYVAPDSLEDVFNICTLSAQCDETVSTVSGLNFSYGGVQYDRVRFSSNGWLAPGSHTTGATFINQLLPDAATPNNTIAAFWADLDGNGTSGSDAGAGFFYFAGFTDPSNDETYTIFGWEGIQLFGSPSKTYSAQIWIKDGTDQIWIVYGAINGGLPDGADGGLTVGAENSAGTAGATRFYRALGSCDPTCTGDIGTPPAVGTDLKVSAIVDGATFTFAATVNNGVPLGTNIQNVVTATDGITTTQALVDTVVSLTPSFADVPTSHFAWRSIEAIYAAGITTGCAINPLRFCPENPVPRWQMAIFLIRALEESPSSVPFNEYFDDIPNDAGAGYINRLFELNITTGCGTRLFCPNQLVPRGQMAIFLVRAIGETPSSVPFNTYFDDIPNDGAAGYINRIFELGITKGCGVRAFCPSSTVTRAEMAAFLVRAFGIPLP